MTKGVWAVAYMSDKHGTVRGNYVGNDYDYANGFLHLKNNNGVMQIINLRMADEAIFTPDAPTDA